MAEEQRRITVTSPRVERYGRLAKHTGAGLLVLLVAWLTLYTIEDGHAVDINYTDYH